MFTISNDLVNIIEQNKNTNSADVQFLKTFKVIFEILNTDETKSKINTNLHLDNLKCKKLLTHINNEKAKLQNYKIGIENKLKKLQLQNKEIEETIFKKLKI